jgi:hypothetical protein
METRRETVDSSPTLMLGMVKWITTKCGSNLTLKVTFQEKIITLIRTTFTGTREELKKPCVNMMPSSQNYHGLISFKNGSGPTNRKSRIKLILTKLGVMFNKSKIMD